MLPEYDAICGITQKEMEEVFKPEIIELGKAQNLTEAETLAKLKQKYDGLVLVTFSGANASKHMNSKINSLNLCIPLCANNIVIKFIHIIYIISANIIGI